MTLVQPAVEADGVMTETDVNVAGRSVAEELGPKATTFHKSTTRREIKDVDEDSELSDIDGDDGYQGGTDEPGTSAVNAKVKALTPVSKAKGPKSKETHESVKKTKGNDGESISRAMRRDIGS